VNGESNPELASGVPNGSVAGSNDEGYV